MIQAFIFAIINILAASILFNIRKMMPRISNGDNRKITNKILNFFDSKWPFYLFNSFLLIINLLLYPINFLSMHNQGATIKLVSASLVIINLFLVAFIFWAVSVLFLKQSVKIYSSIILALTIIECVTAAIMNFITIDTTSVAAAVVLSYISFLFLVLLLLIFIESWLISTPISNLKRRLEGFVYKRKLKDGTTKDTPLALNSLISKDSLKYVFDKNFK